MSKVVFAGVGKTDREITEALAAGIGCFNVESEEEFENLSRLAEAAGRKATAALRINPDVYDPQTHRYTTTGKKETKFGVDIDRAEAFFDRFGRDAARAPGRHPLPHRLADLLGRAVRPGHHQDAGADRRVCGSAAFRCAC